MEIRPIVEERRVFDLHTHFIPGIDDGAVDMKMSLQLLRMEVAEGCRDVFLTSHSWGVYEEYKPRFQKLLNQVKQKGLDIRLYSGMEIECAEEEAEDTIAQLKCGNYNTLAGTNYILIEFSPTWSKKEEVCKKLTVFMREGYKPVIAHAERYQKWSDLEDIRKWKAMGARIQVNYYSLLEETNPAIRRRAQDIVRNRLADFMGSDSHRTFHRPPRLRSGIRYIDSLGDPDYAALLLGGNAGKILDERDQMISNTHITG